MPLKLRKMLGSATSPYIISLMRLIESQSKATLVYWSIDYAEKYILPIYQKYCQNDERGKNALNAAKDWMQGKIKLPAAKKYILDIHSSARELESNPIAQAAARAIGQAASAIHMPAHSLGLAFYGAAAIAYDKAGLAMSAEVYDRIASEECGKMEIALRAVSVENEPDKAKINWNC